jgi:hypothetical protein
MDEVSVLGPNDNDRAGGLRIGCLSAAGPTLDGGGKMNVCDSGGGKGIDGRGILGFELDLDCRGRGVLGFSLETSSVSLPLGIGAGFSAAGTSGWAG